MRKSPAEELFDGGRKANLVGLGIITCLTALLLLSVGPITRYVKEFGKETNVEKIYTAGTYEGVAKGYAGNVVTSITVSETEIESIKISGENETPDFGGKAIAKAEAVVIEKQSSEIDIISGATMTTEAIKKGLDIALAKARGEEVPEEETVKVCNCDENPEEEIECSCKEKKSDANSSATTEVKGREIKISAVPLVKGSFVDGEYEQVVKGHNGDIKFKITVVDSDIVNIELIEHVETAGIYEDAVETVVSAIIEKQSTDVDTASGATVTSKAIIKAVKEVPVK